MTKRVLITGAFGYLGGRLAQVLGHQERCEVLLGSRRARKAPAWLPRAKTIQTDWHSQTRLDEICSDVDAVVHLAGMNRQDCVADPVEALEFNAAGTARLLRSAIKLKVKRFVYVSTAHVYGSPLTGVVTEETCPRSLHPYATSKRAGEDSVRNARACGDIEGIVVRLSNSFGAPACRETDCWQLLVNDLCQQAVTTKTMTLKSSGCDASAEPISTSNVRGYTRYSAQYAPMHRHAPFRHRLPHPHLNAAHHPEGNLPVSLQPHHGYRAIILPPNETHGYDMAKY